MRRVRGVHSRGDWGRKQIRADCLVCHQRNSVVAIVPVVRCVDLRATLGEERGEDGPKARSIVYHQEGRH